MRAPSLALLLALSLAPASNSLAQIKPLGLVLPTENDNIFGDPEKFYMYTNRSFEGESSSPWQAGQFGYVRNPKRTSAGILFTRFHEGVDIRPIHRDPSGEPKDIVRSIADGKIVHASDAPGASSYGRYAVVEHDWGYGPFYSLYAHLSSITAKVGQNVTAGHPIGILGYTGAGIDRTRAHLHLELCLKLSSRFDDWHNPRYAQPNVHGNYNGINLVGIDIAHLYAVHKKNSYINLPAFILSSEPHFRVVVPNTGPLELAINYPWLARPAPGPDPTKKYPSWEIAFSTAGIPLTITPSTKPATEPAVTWVKPSTTNHSYLTRGHLGGTGSSATLQPSGAAYLALATGAFPTAPSPLDLPPTRK